MEIRLPLGKAALLLEPASECWCSVWLEADGERRYLGGDSPSTVRERLRTHLAGPRSTPSGEFEGEPVFWVLSLSEAQCSVYVKFLPVRRLLVQGPEGDWLWQGELSDEDWLIWQAALTRAG